MRIYNFDFGWRTILVESLKNTPDEPLDSK